MVTTTAAPARTRPADPPPRARWHGAAGAIGLGVFVVALAAARGFVRFRGDVTFDDEIGYLVGGLDLATHGLPPASWSPLYVLWYRLLAVVTTDVVALFHLGWTGLVALNLGALAATLRRAGMRTAGVLVTLAVVSVLAVLTPPIASVSLLASAVVLAGVALALGAASLRAALARMLLASVVAAFVRPELAVAAGVALVLWLGAAIRRRAGWAATARELGPAVALGGVLLALLGDPLAGGRSFFAFSQHYAINVVQAGALARDPWAEYPAITRAAFGSATTIGQALRSNPRQFAWHLGRNAERLTTLLAVLEPALALPPVVSSEVSNVLSAVVAIGLVLAALRAWRRAGVGRAGRTLVLAVAIAAVPALTSMLLVQPEPSYALPLLLPLLSLAAWGLLAGGWAPSASLAARAATVALGLALVAALPGPGGTPWWTGRGPAGANPNTTLVRYLARLPLNRSAPVQVVGYWGLGDFARWNSRPVSYVDCSPFETCLRERRLDVMVLDPTIAAFYARLHDAAFAAFRAAPGRWGFAELVAPAPSGAEVFVREDRLARPSR